MHVNTGSDAFFYIFGFEKIETFKIHVDRIMLVLTGKICVSEASLISNATTFVPACNGSREKGDKNTHRMNCGRSRLTQRKRPFLR